MSADLAVKPEASTSEEKQKPKSKNIFYGWWIVIAGSTSQAYTSGTFWQGFGAFFDPLVEHFGWSRALTAGAVSLQRTESGAIAPFVGLFIDKFGPRNVMLAGIFATGLGFILLSRVQNLWQFYLAFTLITLGLSFGTFLTVTTTVANWFVTKRTRAFAIMSAGSGLGGLLVPALVWLIAATDWRTGLLAVGIGYWLTGIPAALVMRSRPEDYGLLPDGRRPVVEDEGESSDATESSGHDQDSHNVPVEVDFTAKEAMRTRAFWQLVLAMGGGQLIISATVHQIPALSSFGISRTMAGMVILAVSMIGLIGRLGSGIVGDKWDKRHVIAVAFLLQFIGTLFFAYTSNNWHLIGFIVFWGIGFGASIPVRFSMLADYFGRRHFGTIMGIMMTFSTVFGVIGPIFVGWMFDVRGNYREPYLILAVSILVTIPLILTLSEPHQPDRFRTPVRR
jgi:MFS family permease